MEKVMIVRWIVDKYQSSSSVEVTYRLHDTHYCTTNFTFSISFKSDMFSTVTFNNILNDLQPVWYPTAEMY